MTADMPISTKLPPDPLAWRPTGHTAKCVLLFTDYACQETVSCRDGNLTMDDVGNALVEQRIRVCVIAPNFDCYKRFSEFQDIDYKDCDQHDKFEEKIKSAGYFAEIIDNFARTVTATATVEMY